MAVERIGADVVLEAAVDAAPDPAAVGDSATGATLEAAVATLGVFAADAVAGGPALATAGGGSLQAETHANTTAAPRK